MIGEVPKKTSNEQIPRRTTHARLQRKTARASSLDPRKFDYSLDYASLDLRKRSRLYRVGRGEQGVLLVEPYKSEILPFWKFKMPAEARASAAAIFKLFLGYRARRDLVGMDMARKFLQMGYTRSRRYANHSSGRKYDAAGKLLPFKNDPVKARSAAIFKRAWKRVEADPIYSKAKAEWVRRLG